MLAYVNSHATLILYLILYYIIIIIIIIIIINNIILYCDWLDIVTILACKGRNSGSSPSLGNNLSSDISWCTYDYNRPSPKTTRFLACCFEFLHWNAQVRLPVGDDFSTDQCIESVSTQQREELICRGNGGL